MKSKILSLAFVCQGLLLMKEKNDLLLLTYLRLALEADILKHFYMFEEGLPVDLFLEDYVSIDEAQKFAREMVEHLQSEGFTVQLLRFQGSDTCLQISL